MTERWVRESYAAGHRWWRWLPEQEARRAFQRQQDAIAEDFGQARRAGRSPGSAGVQALARRLLDWLSVTTRPTRDDIVRLCQTYFADPGLAASYERYGAGTAALVCAALTVYAERNLGD